MGTFSNPMPNGSVSLQTLWPEIKRVHIASTSLTFATQTAAYNLNNWKVAIQQNEYLYATRGLCQVDVTTDDPNIVTTAKTRKFVTNNPVPSVIAYLDSNFEDYWELTNTLRGGQYGVIYELEDRTFLMMYEDDIFKPIPAQLYAIGKGLPMSGDANNFPIHIMHNDKADFEKLIAMDPDWDFDELGLAMPVGLKVIRTGDCSVAAGCTVTVYIETRGGAAYTGLAVGDFSVVESNFLDTAAVTAASDDGAGAYTLTLQKGTTPGDLAAGDYITLRVKKLSSSDITHSSNLLTIVAVA
jgi:hypothetical protein